MFKDTANTLEPGPPVLLSMEDVSPNVPADDRAVFDRLVKIAKDNNLNDLSDAGEIIANMQKKGEVIDKYVFNPAGPRYPMELAAEIPSGDLQEVTREVATLVILTYVSHWHGPFKVDLGAVIHTPPPQQNAVSVENVWLTHDQSDEKKGDDKKVADFLLGLYDELDLRAHLNKEDYTALCEVRKLERKLLPDLLEVVQLRRERREHWYKKLEMLRLMAEWIKLSKSLPWERILSVIPEGIKNDMKETNLVVTDLGRASPDLFQP